MKPVDELDLDTQQGDASVQIIKFDRLARELRACLSRVDYIKNNSSKITDYLLARIIRNETKVLSLDVFDTFLLRNNKPEAVRFYEIASVVRRTLDLSRSTDDIFLARAYAMQMAYRTREPVLNCREGHIEDIIKIQARFLGLDETRTAEFKSIELAYEARNLIPNYALAALCRAAVKHGIKVILLSDMYLTSECIQNVCSDICGDVSYISDIHSSADHVISKRSGLIFDHLSRLYNMEPGQFMHIGDNLDSDVRAARRAGWKSEYFPISDKEIDERSSQLYAFRATRLKSGAEISAFANA